MNLFLARKARLMRIISWPILEIAKKTLVKISMVSVEFPSLPKLFNLGRLFSKMAEAIHPMFLCNVPWLCCPSNKRECQLVFPLNLDWSCDLLWPIELDRSDVIRVPGLVHKSPWSLCFYSLGMLPQGHYVRKLGEPAGGWETKCREVRATQPTASTDPQTSGWDPLGPFSPATPSAETNQVRKPRSDQQRNSQNWEDNKHLPSGLWPKSGWVEHRSWFLHDNLISASLSSHACPPDPLIVTRSVNHQNTLEFHYFQL